MKKAVRDHLQDFVAIIALVAVAVGAGGYILSNQRLRFPLIEEKPFTLKIELRNAQAVTPGQGQTVRVSGMRVGSIGKVELKDGKAIVRLDIDKEFQGLIRRDASALLRPRTGLKDMFLAVDPGNPSEPAMQENETIPLANSTADVNPDEILSVLDHDTREYLKLLISGAGGGLRGRGGDLQEVFARLGPLHRDLARLNRVVSQRKRNLERLIHNYGRTITRLGRQDKELTELVAASSQVFGRLAREDQQISEAVERLPSALSQTEATLRRVKVLGEVAEPAFKALRPAIAKVDEANRELRPLAIEAEPLLRTKIRPFVREARPYLENLRPAARNLADGAPDLRESFYGLNRFFNTLAYNPGGREELTGNLARDTNREEGTLFWLAWLAHNTNSMFNTSDAMGPFRRFILFASCGTYENVANTPGGAATLESIVGIADILDDASLCPPQ
ncbi:MAG TPA: MlaD family protein [Thermoleophilaceae bacterium]|nr:MlaD family protein [Thermoleophilaceae bacterium]